MDKALRRRRAFRAWVGAGALGVASLGGVAFGQGAPGTPVTPKAKGAIVDQQVEKLQSPDATVTRRASTRLIRDDRESVWQLNTVLDMGGALTKPSTGPLEKEAKGYSLGLGLRLNWDSPFLYLGAGVGWQRTVLEGSARPNPPEGTDPASSTEPFVSATLLTQGVEANLQVQFHATEDLVVGPVFLGRFGSDVTYSFKADPKPFALLAGLQLGWNRPAAEAGLNYRLGVVTDVNIKENQIFAAFLSLEFGIPFVSPDRVVKVEKISKTTVRKEEVIKTETKTKVVVQEVVRVDVPRDFKLFRGDKSSLLTIEGQKALGNLARGLAAESKVWGKVRVDVAVASRASTKQDLLLAKRRATAIRNALAAAGVSGDRVLMKALGSEIPPEKPTDVAKYYDKDDVSFTFSEVSDDGALKKIIDSFKASVSTGGAP